MTEWNKEQALARYVELWNKRHEAFDQRPNNVKRIARGDYDFFDPVIDTELDEVQQEAMRNGFVLDSTWDENKQDIVYTIEQISPEDHAAFLAEEQEVVLEDLKWKYSKGLLQP